MSVIISPPVAAVTRGPTPHTSIKANLKLIGTSPTAIAEDSRHARLPQQFTLCFPQTTAVYRGAQRDHRDEEHAARHYKVYRVEGNPSNFRNLTSCLCQSLTSYIRYHTVSIAFSTT